MNDVGMANERTSLAWQRTALGGIAGAAIATRLTWESLGPVSLLPLVLSLSAASWILSEGSRRYRAAGLLRRRDGHTPLLITAVAASVGLLQLVALIAR